jgi:lipopolysaccharide exporter
MSSIGGSVSSSFWRSGTFILAGTAVATVVFRLGSNLILTRLLSPEIFGFVAIVISVSVVLTLITDMGFHAFVVRHPRGEEREFLDTVWTVRVIRSAILVVLILLAAPWLASLYGRPETTPAILVLAFVFALDGVSSLGVISATRQERAGFVSIFDFVMTVLTTCILVAVVIVIRSEWGFLLGFVLGAAVRAVASYTAFPGSFRRLSLDRGAAKELVAFAWIVVPSSIITLALTQWDKVVFPRFLDLGEFGLYMVALGIVGAITSFTIAYTHRIVYPALARLSRDDPEGLIADYYQLRLYVTAALALSIGMVAGASGIIVQVLFDDRYLGVAWYLGVLVFAPAFQYNVGCAEAYLVAVGKISWVLTFNVLRLVHVIFFGSIGYYFIGITGLLLAMATMDVPAMVVGWELLRRAKALRLWHEASFLALLAFGFGLGYVADLTAKWLIAKGWLPQF